MTLAAARSLFSSVAHTQGFDARTLAGVDFEVGRASFADQGRAQVMAVNEGALDTLDCGPGG